MYDILIVDDEADIRDLISDVFNDNGYSTRKAKNSIEAFEQVADKVPSAIILDIWLKNSELDGLGILETVKRKYPSVPVIMISGHGNIETAVKSLKIGAYDYVEKPFKEDKLLNAVKKGIEVEKLKSENRELRSRNQKVNLLIGNSPAITNIRQNIDKIAPTGSRIMITGPSGSGREVMARIIHNKSSRKAFPFVIFNSSCLSLEDIDENLFGTADNSGDINSPARKVGLLEIANGGTLFIDEVTDLPKEVQAKIVRFLQNGEFERIGSDKKIKADIRVISASNKNLSAAIAAGEFREDLYYRLNVVSLKAPSLKERKEDIPLLSDYFLSQAAAVNKLPKRNLSSDSLAALQAYDWPGNVRQLKNIIEWLLIMSPSDNSDDIPSEMLPREIFSSTPASITPEVNTDIMSLKLRQAREVFERQYLMAQIERFGGNISRTASFVGMERSALHRKLKSLKVASEEAETIDA